VWLGRERVTPHYAAALFATFRCAAPPRCGAFADERASCLATKANECGRSSNSQGRRPPTSMCVPGRVVRRGRCGVNVGDARASVVRAAANASRFPPFDPFRKAGARMDAPRSSNRRAHRRGLKERSVTWRDVGIFAQDCSYLLCISWVLGIQPNRNRVKRLDDPQAPESIASYVKKGNLTFNLLPGDGAGKSWGASASPVFASEFCSRHRTEVTLIPKALRRNISCPPHVVLIGSGEYSRRFYHGTGGRTSTWLVRL
jgi:hypothetical protein